VSEPKITVNGTELSEAESMTVRVALGAFAVDLRGGLGDDELGFQICNGYNRCLNKIFELMKER
jgi:hypothetical protein